MGSYYLVMVGNQDEPARACIYYLTILEPVPRVAVVFFFFNDKLELYVAFIKWIKWISFRYDPGNHTLRGSP